MDNKNFDFNTAISIAKKVMNNLKLKESTLSYFRKEELELFNKITNGDFTFTKKELDELMLVDFDTMITNVIEAIYDINEFSNTAVANGIKYSEHCTQALCAINFDSITDKILESKDNLNQDVMNYF